MLRARQIHMCFLELPGSFSVFQKFSIHVWLNPWMQNLWVQRADWTLTIGQRGLGECDWTWGRQGQGLGLGPALVSPWPGQLGAYAPGSPARGRQSPGLCAHSPPASSRTARYTGLAVSVLRRGREQTFHLTYFIFSPICKIVPSESTLPLGSSTKFENIQLKTTAQPFQGLGLAPCAGGCPSHVAPVGLPSCM